MWVCIHSARAGPGHTRVPACTFCMLAWALAQPARRTSACIARPSTSHTHPCTRARRTPSCSSTPCSRMWPPGAPSAPQRHCERGGVGCSSARAHLCCQASSAQGCLPALLFAHTTIWAAHCTGCWRWEAGAATWCALWRSCCSTWGGRPTRLPLTTACRPWRPRARRCTTTRRVHAAGQQPCDTWGVACSEGTARQMLAGCKRSYAGRPCLQHSCRLAGGAKRLPLPSHTCAHTQVPHLVDVLQADLTRGLHTSARGHVDLLVRAGGAWGGQP